MREYLHSPIRWFGGKGKMLFRLMPLVPDGGKPYCEPYCGGASLFFAREPAPVEVLNDLDENIVNLFRVLQDRKTFEELRHRIMYTPYARSELARAVDLLESGEGDNVARAWAFFVAQNQSFSGTVMVKRTGWGTGFRSVNGIAERTNECLMRLAMLDAFCWRLILAQIDCKDALEVIEYWDNDEAVFYVDPPYHPDTRKDKSVYRVEPDDEHHRKLVELLLRIKGSVTLSGYAHPVYRPLEENGWARIDFSTVCHAVVKSRGSRLRGKNSATLHAPRIETVWLNPKAVELIKKQGKVSADFPGAFNPLFTQEVYNV